MAFGADDRQTSGGLHLGCELDIGTTSGHVGRDGNLSGASCLGHDLGLQGVLLGVQHVVFDTPQLEHAAQQLRDLDRSCADQHGASLAHEPDDLLDHGVVLFAFGLVDEILAVVADHRTVRRDDDDVEFVDAPELRGFRLGRTGHAGQLVVHAEVVLQGDRGEGLRRRLDLHVLLGLDGLMQTVRIAASVENTSRLLVHDLHLVVHDHILHVLLEHGVGLQQLVHRVYALRLDRVVVDHLVALAGLLLRVE